VLHVATVSELTVEDPAEAFEDLRDRNDLRMLLNLHAFIDEGFQGSSGGGPVRSNKKGKVGKMGPPVEKAWAEKWRVNLKIAGVSVPSGRYLWDSLMGPTAPVPASP
jgi:histone acetyltransferase 1